MNKNNQEQIDYFLDRFIAKQKKLKQVQKVKKMIESKLKEQLCILKAIPFPTDQDKEMITDIETALNTH